MTTRRRSTWDRKASAPPATPGYTEGSDHPAYQPDPDASKYMNGDPSSWAEDPTVGPYPNSAPPATPGTSEVQGHPATDAAHQNFGGSKAASRSLRATMEHKASKCIRIATAMLGRSASVDSIEDQALDLMNLGDRQIQAMLARIAETVKGANETLPLPGGKAADDLLADDLMVEEDDVKKKAKKSDDEEEVEVEETDDEDKEAAKKASYYQRQAAYWAGVASKKAKKADEDDEEEELLAEMEEEEAKKKAGQNSSKASASDDDEEEKMLAEMLEDEKKKASKKQDELFGGKAAPFAKKDEKEEDDAKKEASVEGLLAGMLDQDPIAEDPFMDDPMSMMDDMGGDGMSDEEMAIVYGGRFAGKKNAKKSDDDETEETEEEEPSKEASDDEDESEEKEEAKKEAALKPRARTASAGPRTLGSVANGRTASTEIADLSRLWESAPDVSKVFGS